jgi:hypothetical protein
MSAGSACLTLGFGRRVSVARDSEVGPSVVVAGRTLGRRFARWDPRLFVALLGTEVRLQPGLTLGVFRSIVPRSCLCHRFPNARVGLTDRMMNP